MGDACRSRVNGASMARPFTSRACSADSAQQVLCGFVAGTAPGQWGKHMGRAEMEMSVVPAPEGLSLVLDQLGGAGLTCVLVAKFFPSETMIGDALHVI